MYEPVLNSVLVQIDDKDAEWGSGNDESMLGKSYSKGQAVVLGDVMPTRDHPIREEDVTGFTEYMKTLKGKQIMWNEGTEAGTTFEFDGKLFGFVYWWDIRGVLVGEKASKA